jgi:hypothetical protein
MSEPTMDKIILLLNMNRDMLREHKGRNSRITSYLLLMLRFRMCGNPPAMLLNRRAAAQ